MEQEKKTELEVNELDKVSGGTDASSRIIDADCPNCGRVQAIRLSRSKCQCSMCGTTFTI